MTTPDPQLVAEALADAGAPTSAPPLITRMALGASRECWTIDAGGDHYVLKRDPVDESVLQTSRRVEYEVLEAAAAAGVPVAAPVAYEPAGGRFGSAGFITRFVPGTSSPRRIIGLAEERRHALARELARAYARLHDHARVPAAFSGQEAPSGWQARTAPGGVSSLDGLLPTLESGVRELGSRAVLRLALAWLVDHQPPEMPPVLTHGDARIGNIHVTDDGRLAALMDWELARPADRAEDLAFFCLRPWRFGQDAKGAGGIASIDAFLDEYARAARQAVDHARLRYFSIVAHLRWGLYCLDQSSRYARGEHTSLERLALGRRISQVEWDLLELIGDE